MNAEKKKIGLISGISGQDGSFSAELLLEKGYEVHGIIRRSSSHNTQKIDHILDKIHLHYGDLTDSLSIDDIICKVKPDFVFHLGAQSQVRVSFDVPAYTTHVNALGTLYMLEAVRKYCPKAKFYNAATSELFGKVQETLQKETTPFNPRSPYGSSKLYAYSITKLYREAYNLFAVNGILFNHESERRGDEFVTQKIVKGLINYIINDEPLYLGNLDASRDWGYTPDYVEAMWLMLQHDKPDDFVIATGETHTIKEFIEECLKYLRIEKTILYYEWRKDDKNRDILWDTESDKLIIGIDEKFYRPSEVEYLVGDPSKAKEKLGWEPKTKFRDLVGIMMKHKLKEYYEKE